MSSFININDGLSQKKNYLDERRQQHYLQIIYHQQQIMQNRTPQCSFSINYYQYFSKNLIIYFQNTLLIFMRSLKTKSFEFCDSQLSYPQQQEISKQKVLDSHILPGEMNLNDIQTFLQKEEITDQGKKQTIIDPDSLFYIIWQIANTILIIYFFFVIPFQMLFIDYLPKFLLWTQVAAIIIFLIDIFVCLNTSYYEQGYIERDIKKIQLNYIQNFLIFDVIVILILIILCFKYEETDLSVVQVSIYLLFYLKFYEVNKTRERIKYATYTNNNIWAFYKLFEIILVIIWICHLFACVFHRIGQIAIRDGVPSWQQESKMFNFDQDGQTLYVYNELSLKLQYMYSFYWAVSTMISVGYGDITSCNTSEVLVNILSMFVSCILFAYSINAIWQLIRQFHKQNHKFDKQFGIISNYMNINKTDPKIRNEVHAYLNHYWESLKQRDYKKEEEIINRLPIQMRMDLKFSTHMLFIQEFFNHKYDIQFLKKLSLIVELEIYLEGDIIFEESLMDECSLYYLQKGQIEFYQKRNKIFVIKQIEQSQVFGHLAFVTGKNRTLSCRVQKLSYVSKITRQNFLELIKEYQLDQEIFFNIQSKLQSQQGNKLFQLKCWICNSNSHLSNLCDQVHYVPNKYKIIKKQLKQTNLRLQSYHRHLKKPFRAKLDNKVIQNQADILNRYHQLLDFQQKYDDIKIKEDLKNLKQLIQRDSYLPPNRSSRRLQDDIYLQEPDNVVEIEGDQRQLMFQKPLQDFESDFQIDLIKSYNGELKSNNADFIIDEVNNCQRIKTIKQLFE
ncbi:hypothetical protein pb186bvf_003221 [Paramecium bursaria]